MAKLVYEFDMYDDADFIEVFQNAEMYREALHNIHHMVRSQLKHGDEELSPRIENLLEEIKISASVADV